MAHHKSKAPSSKAPKHPREPKTVVPPKRSKVAGKSGNKKGQGCM